MGLGMWERNMAEGKLVPFGKYKDQPVEVLAQDKGYAAQRWFRDKVDGLIR